MLSGLVGLARPLERPDEPACAIAIYAGPDGLPLAARESGEEGVACLDDAARALELWCDLWQRTGLAVCREWIDGLLAFCRSQQLADGRFLNFILDWRGTPNVDGVTSRPDGGSFWHARGARAMVKVWRTLADDRARADYERARAWFDDRPVPADVRAIQVRAVLEAAADDRAAVSRWCDEIAARRAGDVLLDNPDERSEPHLWGHIQEGALAEAGAALARPDLIAVARRSADRFLVPLVEAGFALPTVQPYGVASVIYDLDQLFAATGDPRYRGAAGDARAWFDGRNPAGRPVYDRARGRVADGVDNGRINPHSGAESNVVGAQALIDDVAAWLLQHPEACSPRSRSSRPADLRSAAS